MTASTILAWVIFGGIGMIYFAYGKMKDLWQPMVLGVALMVYPYLGLDDLWLWIIGSALTLAIFFAKR